MTKHRLRAALAGLIASTMLVLTAACGTPDEDPATESLAGAFVGRVKGTEARLALLFNGERAAGYLCDGKDVSVWLAASDAADDGAELLDRDGNHQGTVTFTDATVAGSITIDGTDHNFTLEPSAGDAGLYRGYADLGDGGSVEAGWIVLNDGNQTGAITTRTPTGATLAPAPPLDPDAGTTTLDRIGELAVQHLTTGFVDKIAF